MVVAIRTADSTPREPAIDVFFSNDGGCYRTHWKHPPGSPPSTSSPTSVVAAIRPFGSIPQGAAIGIFFSFDGGRCWTYGQHPNGGRHRCLL
jgi:hypothetical protein